MRLAHRQHGSLRHRVLLIAALLCASVPAILRGQIPVRAPNPAPDGTALLAASYEKRLEALEERRQRQVALGLADEAARISQQIAQLKEQHVRRCSEIWSLMEQLQQPEAFTSGSRFGFGGGLSKETKKRIERLQQLQKDVSLIVECGEGPTSRRAKFDDGLPDGLEPDAIVRGQLESDMQYARTALFVEPVLLLTTDADVPSPSIAWMADIADDIKGKSDSSSVARLKLLMELNRQFRNLDQATAILEAALTTETTPIGRGFVLELLRGVAQYAGNPSAALRYLDAEMDAFQSVYGPNSPRLCYMLWQSIPLHLDNRQPDRALAAAERCVALGSARGQKSLTYASALSNLGLVYHRTGAIPRAIETYEKALAIMEQVPAFNVGGSESTGQQAQLNLRANLGLAYWQQGDPARASVHFQTARERMTKEGSASLSERATIASLAKLQAEVDALVTLERQLASATTALLALPLVLERKGLALDDKAATMKTLAKKADVAGEYRSLLAYRARLARGTPIRPDDPSETGRQMGEADLQIQELEHTARMDAMTSPLLDGARPTPHPDYIKYSTALANETSKLVNDYYKRPPKNDRRSDTEVMMQLHAAARAKVDPKFKHVLEAQQAAASGDREELLARIQSRLPDTAVLLEMLRYRPMTVMAATEAERWQPARYGAYVIKRTGRPVFIDFGSADQIDDLVVEFRRTLAQPRGTLAHDLGRRLDDLLMQPLRPILGGATTLYLSPDGILNLLPFAALVDEQDRYLLETFSFNYVSTGRDLTRTRSQAGTASNVPVVLGDPAFDGVVDTTAAAAENVATRGLRDRTFDRLPGTATESRAVGSLLSPATVLTGTEATETALKTVQSPRVLHIATHGFFLADQDLSTAMSAGGATRLEDPMLRSGIVLAGANIGKSGNDDGVLTALEAAGLNLSGTQLVVLSACETGVGEVKTGEGVFGLRRAFMVAGAETLVMSLWQVDDTATQRLMAEFYQRLTRGQDRGEALRQASLTVMKDPAYRHPFFWASFIAAGETGPLRR